jgi:hypothetical protein
MLYLFAEQAHAGFSWNISILSKAGYNGYCSIGLSLTMCRRRLKPQFSQIFDGI